MIPKLTCCVIDDDQFAIKNISDYIARMAQLELTGAYLSPVQALKDIRNWKMPDIVFLDIEMPELSGLDVAELLAPSISIIFTTAHSKYALNAFEKNAVDYLLKPFTFEKFTKAVLKVSERKKNKVQAPQHSIDQIFINPGVKGKLLQVHLCEITHIEALDHSICIHQLNEKTISNMGINKIQERLPENRFARVHRSFIVNIPQVRSIDANEIILRNNVAIPLGETYREEFFAKIQERNS